MDFLGIGFTEMIIVGLIIVLVAGPERSLIWARELGRYTAQLRQYLSQIMQEFQKEIGPEGRELMDAAQQFNREARDLQRMANPRQAIGTFNKTLESLPLANSETPPKSKTASTDTSKPAEGPYTGWTKSASNAKSASVPSEKAVEETPSANEPQASEETTSEG